jgi:hypothetical protein
MKFSILTNDIKRFFEKYSIKIEVILGGFFLVGFLLINSSFSLAITIITLSSGLLAIFYFLGSLKVSTNKSIGLISSIVPKFLHYTWSFTIIALMFNVLSYPFQEIFSRFAMINSLICIGIIIVSAFKDRLSQKLKIDLARTIILLFLIASLTIT